MMLKIEYSKARPSLHNPVDEWLAAPRDRAAILRGGEGGIRTLEPLTGLTVFKTVAIDHSATSPYVRLYRRVSLKAREGVIWLKQLHEASRDTPAFHSQFQTEGCMDICRNAFLLCAAR